MSSLSATGEQGAVAQLKRGGRYLMSSKVSSAVYFVGKESDMDGANDACFVRGRVLASYSKSSQHEVKIILQKYNRPFNEDVSISYCNCNCAAG